MQFSLVPTINFICFSCLQKRCGALHVWGQKCTTTHTSICYHACAFGTYFHCANCTSDPLIRAKFAQINFLFLELCQNFPTLDASCFLFLCYHVCHGEISEGEGAGGVLRRCSGQITNLSLPTRLPPLALICRKRILRTWISGPSGSCTRQQALKLYSICLLWRLMLLQSFPTRG